MSFFHKTAEPTDGRHAVRNALLQETRNNVERPLSDEDLIKLVQENPPEYFQCKYLFQYEPADRSRKAKDISIYPLARLLCLKPSPPALHVVQAFYDVYREAIFSQDNEGRLPLHFACRYKASKDVIDFLIACHPKAVDTRSIYGMLPVHYAAANHYDTAVLERLLEQSPDSIRVQTQTLALPLHHASLRQAHVDMVEYLLRRYPEGALVEDRKGFLPIHNTCLCKSSSDDGASSSSSAHVVTLQILQSLLDTAPDSIQARTCYQQLPLHLACNTSTPSLPVIKFLIQHYPEALQTMTLRGMKPLEVAVANGAPSAIVEFLRRLEWDWQTWEDLLSSTVQERKALLDAITNDGDANHLGKERSQRSTSGETSKDEISPLVYFNHRSARQSDHRSRFRDELVKRPMDEQAIFAFINKNPKLCRCIYSVPYQYSLKVYPLSHICCLQPSLDLVVAVYHAHPDAIQHADEKGRYPLHYACRSGASKQVVQFLSSLYPDAVQRAAVNGLLPLHYACLKGQDLETVQTLVSLFPASVRVPSHRLLLPLHFASMKDSAPGLIDYLIPCYPEAAGFRSVTQYISLHYACSSRRSLAEIQSLVNAFPKGIRAWNRVSELPLHMACSNHDHVSMDVIRFLCENHPKAITAHNKQKQTPLDVARAGSPAKDVIALLEVVYENVDTLADLELEERCKMIGEKLQERLPPPINAAQDGREEEHGSSSLQQQLRTRNSKFAAPTTSRVSVTPTNSNPSSDWKANPEARMLSAQSAITSSQRADGTVDAGVQPGAMHVAGPNFNMMMDSSDDDDDDEDEPMLFSSALDPSPLPPPAVHSTTTMFTDTPIAAEVSPLVTELEAELEEYKKRFEDSIVTAERAVVLPEPELVRAGCCAVL